MIHNPSLSVLWKEDSKCIGGCLDKINVFPMHQAVCLKHVRHSLITPHSQTAFRAYLSFIVKKSAIKTSSRSSYLCLYDSKEYTPKCSILLVNYQPIKGLTQSHSWWEIENWSSNLHRVFFPLYHYASL